MWEHTFDLLLNRVCSVERQINRDHLTSCSVFLLDTVCLGCDVQDVLRALIPIPPTSVVVMIIIYL